MDENYLDDLLKEVSASDQKNNNSFEKNVEKDSGVDIDFSDLDDISLDELDGFDNLELEDFDFDDIDFDDVDVTSLDSTSKKNIDTEYVPAMEDFDADALLENIDAKESIEESVEESFDDMDALISEMESLEMDEEKKLSNDAVMSEVKEHETASDNISDADMDSFLNDMLMGEDTSVPENLSGGFEDVFSEADNQHLDDVDNMDLDDLFSALGIDETENLDNSYTAGEDSLDELFQQTMESSSGDDILAGIEDISDTGKKSKKKRNTGKKKTLSEVLFGEADEDDAEEERRLEELKIKKQEKKALKKEKNEEKKIAKQEKLAVKQSESSTKKQEKQAKKQAKQAELLAEYEAEKTQKKVPTFVVIMVFAAFAVLGVFVILGSKSFDYSQGIKKAKNYFERQRYRLAYDEVVGLDIKEEDEKLRDRIYTVMYVERLYESYVNNMELGRPDKALDALIRGLEKYDEHYAEALELRIVEDINSCKEKVVNALWNTYGLSEAAAYELMLLEGQEYNDALLKYCAGMMTGE